MDTVTKDISPGKTIIDLHSSDFKSDAVAEDDKEKEEKNEKKEKAEKHKDENGVPWKVFLGSAYVGHRFDELVILCPSRFLDETEKVKKSNDCPISSMLEQMAIK